MGQVRRRVVNQGVLVKGLALLGVDRPYNLHALRMEFMATRQAHDPALTIDIFLETDNTLNLPSGVLASPQRGASL
jgi:hypothetical protein